MHKYFSILVNQWTFITKNIIAFKSLSCKNIILSIYIFFAFQFVNCQMGFSDDDDEEINVYYPKNSIFQMKNNFFI